MPHALSCGNVIRHVQTVRLIGIIGDQYLKFQFYDLIAVYLLDNAVIVPVLPARQFQRLQRLLRLYS